VDARESSRVQSFKYLNLTHRRIDIDITQIESPVIYHSIMSPSATQVNGAAPSQKAAAAPEEPKDTTHTPSQRYLSTRGGEYGVSTHWAEKYGVRG